MYRRDISSIHVRGHLGLFMLVDRQQTPQRLIGVYEICSSSATTDLIQVMWIILPETFLIAQHLRGRVCLACSAKQAQTRLAELGKASGELLPKTASPSI